MQQYADPIRSKFGIHLNNPIPLLPGLPESRDGILRTLGANTPMSLIDHNVTSFSV
jgi:hypothetical protein